MIVFRIHCNFFIILSIRLRTCSSNGFLFFTRQIVRDRKIGHVSELLRAQTRAIGIGQFVQACASSIIVIVIEDISILHSSLLRKAVNLGKKIFSQKLETNMKIMIFKISKTDSSYMSNQLTFLITQETYPIKITQKMHFQL